MGVCLCAVVGLFAVCARGAYGGDDNNHHGLIADDDAEGVNHDSEPHLTEQPPSIMTR